MIRGERFSLSVAKREEEGGKAVSAAGRKSERGRAKWNRVDRTKRRKLVFFSVGRGVEPVLAEQKKRKKKEGTLGFEEGKMTQGDFPVATLRVCLRSSLVILQGGGGRQRKGGECSLKWMKERGVF